MSGSSAKIAPGLTLHSAGFYDFTVWLMSRGRERALRERILELADLKSGEAMLDVGCGTGTLAIAAKRHVGAAGRVHGIDASPEMLARAETKAKRAGQSVEFRLAPAQALPFPDASFDVVTSTVMLHHLPRPSRQQCFGEIRRVLKPGGRLLVVDFATGEKKGHFSLFHGHGHTDADQIVALMQGAGFTVTGRGAVGTGNLYFVQGRPDGARL